MKLFWLVLMVSNLVAVFITATLDSELFVLCYYIGFLLSFPLGVGIGMLMSSSILIFLGNEWNGLAGTLMFGGMFVMGYVQWFVLVPHIVKKIKKVKSKNELLLNLLIILILIICSWIFYKIMFPTYSWME